MSSLLLTVQGILSGNKVAIPISHCESLRMPMDTQKVSNVLIYSPKQTDVRNHLILEKELLAAMRLCDMCGV